MRLYNVISLVALVAMATSTSAKPRKGSLAWKSCPYYTVTSSDSSSSSGEDFAECAVYNAPLCYPGICETPENVDSTIEVFVKRLPATKNSKAARNVWLLQGGPGISSVPLESTMVSLHAQLEGAVNVYLMDHRGTGRSTRLDCSAAKPNNGSVWSTEVGASAVGGCARELFSKYGDLSSFSTTSAATDVSHFIGEHTNGKDTIVFGWSYGTALVERLMHLKPVGVTGYVLDGIATSSGAPTDEFPYYSRWDTDFGEVTDRFLALCEQDDDVSSHFKKRSLSSTIQRLIKTFDKNSDSACAGILNGMQESSPDEPPSFALRRALGTMMSDAEMRKFIPPVVYRLNRCTIKDIEALRILVELLSASTGSKVEDDAYQSPLLFNLIIFSEMWETPTPSVATIKKRFTDVLISDTGIYSTAELYCAFSKEKSETCNKFQYSNYEASSIIYKRDEYWNKSAVIPRQASVLLLSSKLDGQTTHKYAEYLLDALQGDNKELITFEYATHGTIATTQLVDGDSTSPICGMELLVSYIKSGGDLKLLDKSCVGKMPGFNLNIATGFDPYNDDYDSLNNSQSSSD